MRPTRARIDLARLRGNAALAAARAPTSRLMAVIKADGYGHGAVAVAKALIRYNQLNAFGVATLAEGIELREAGSNFRKDCV